MSSSSRGKVKSSRRVSFLSKCQVIPWSDDEDDEETATEALEQRAADRDKKARRRRRLNVFRALGTSSSSGMWDESDQASNGGSNTGPTDTRDRNSRRGVSPSLPINKHPVPSHFDKLQRRRLYSPPPPAISPSIQPLQHRLALAAASAQSQPSLASTSQSTIDDDNNATITKPRAIRKPLSLGPHTEEEAEGTETIKGLTKNEGQGERKKGTLQVPAVVGILKSLPKVERPEAAAILNWKDDEDDGEGGSEQTATSSEMREEDLNQECVCIGCESKMIAALDPTYSTPWTRPARKKYLTDLKQAQIEGTKAIPKVPAWLETDHLELHSGSATSLKEVKADEVDAKKGTSKTTLLPTAKGSSYDASKAEDGGKVATESESKQRKEEQQASKSPKKETRTLSNDSSSGLWTGGGGARAMMRQLEEADRQEKRASIQRTNSKGSASNENEKERAIPIGAVKDTLVQPFTVPRRLSDNSISPQSRLIDLPRTPSPRTDMNKKTISPSKTELEKDKEREHRHPSPSLLIRRELTLGIPVHSNTNLQKATTSWPHHPPTRSPSPGLLSPSTLYDIAEVASNISNTSVPSGANTPRRAHSIGHKPSERRNSVTLNGDAKVKRSSSLSAKAVNRKSLDSTRSGLGVNLTQHAAQSGNANDTTSEGRFGQARHKAKSSIKDFVARIKN